jgi:hypothetical protein
VIRQAISCDICGAEKKQTNHWFVACEQAGELRVSGWNSRNRLRTGSKHLCGQTCLHKLVDEFMARTIAARLTAPAAAEPFEPEPARIAADTSLTSPAAYPEIESSARLITPPAAPEPAIVPALIAPRPSGLVSMPAQCSPARPSVDTAVPVAIVVPEDEPPAYSSRRWRAEAWERERSRELHAVERHPDLLRRRKGF